MKLKYNLGSPELSHLSSKELIAPRGLQGHHLRNRQPLLIPQRLLPPWLRERCFAWNGEAAPALGGGGGVVGIQIRIKYEEENDYNLCKHFGES